MLMKDILKINENTHCIKEYTYYIKITTYPEEYVSPDLSFKELLTLPLTKIKSFEVLSESPSKKLRLNTFLFKTNISYRPCIDDEVQQKCWQYADDILVYDPTIDCRFGIGENDPFLPVTYQLMNIFMFDYALIPGWLGMEERTLNRILGIRAANHLNCNRNVTVININELVDAREYTTEQMKNMVNNQINLNSTNTLMQRLGGYTLVKDICHKYGFEFDLYVPEHIVISIPFYISKAPLAYIVTRLKTNYFLCIEELKTNGILYRGAKSKTFTDFPPKKHIFNTRHFYFKKSKAEIR